MTFLLRGSLFLFLPLLAACDTITRTRFVVPEATAEDAAIVKAAVAQVAAESGYVDLMCCHRERPEVLVYYEQDRRDFPMCLGARKDDCDVAVDLFYFHPGWHKPKEFAILEAYTGATLKDRFGSRLLLPRKYPSPQKERKLVAEYEASLHAPPLPASNNPD